MDTLPTHALKILQVITPDHTLSPWRIYGEEKFSGHIGNVHNDNIHYGFSNMNTAVECSDTVTLTHTMEAKHSQTTKIDMEDETTGVDRSSVISLPNPQLYSTKL